MHQRHEHLPAAQLLAAHIVLDDGVAAGEPMFFLESLKDALGGMTLSPQQAKTACRGPRCLAGLALSSFKMASITPSHSPSFGRRTGCCR
jgi:hypothetical protein